MTEGDNDGDAEEQENATSTFVGISRITPDGPEGGTDVVFFSTNSTGQLALLLLFSFEDDILAGHRP